MQASTPRYSTPAIVLAWTMVVLVAVHALAGLKHLLVDRDRVFQRMWPVRR